ncbi:MAG TPA: hypothetical protein DEP84_02990, partial [Chloroflexi bacterium]|nr:hypothetical protein [Chloroflexota bacterium]
AREKSIRHGHPSTLHLWWARRPLAAARAVIFAQMVDDPSEHTDVLLSDPAKKRAATRELHKRLEAWNRRKAAYEAARGEGNGNVPDPGPEPTLEGCVADLERERLFRIIEELVKWENTTNEQVLQQARDEIWQSWRYTCAENADHPRARELFDRHKLPAFHDPFAGGGALPLEAQRLGLEAYASDLNPVAVLINKAMIEIPPKFANRPPVNPEARAEQRLIAQTWKGAQGLAEDVRYYGKWMRDEAEKRIGHLYPKVEITAEMAEERPDLKPYVGQKLTVIAWLWARTVKSPNPAFADVEVPLASTFMLSTKPGKEAYVEPVIEDGGYRFTVKVGKPKSAEAAKNGTSAGKRAAFKCVMSGVPISYDFIRSEGHAGRIGTRLMAIVADGERGRIYLDPIQEHESTARTAQPEWQPDCEMPKKHRNFQPPVYGMNNLGDIFTSRQLVALTTFSNLVREVRERVMRDAINTGVTDDGKLLAAGGTGVGAYGDAIGVYLAFSLSKLLDRCCTLVTWFPERDSTYHVFGRQALPMTWDFAETNVLDVGTGSFLNAVVWEAEVVEALNAALPAYALQVAAQDQSVSAGKVVSTDPPYYDNINYADLSDFFYVWLRRAVRPIFPDLFATLAVPKTEELVATPYRHENRQKAEAYFLDGMTAAMRCLAKQTHPAFPVTIYYAFKQSESKSDSGTASTGWETFLEALMRAGFSITGTWPVRTELANRILAKNNSALASSIVLVCRPNPTDTFTVSRREFVSALKTELPIALAHLQRANIAPVDLAQAAIGPGMAVYTRYAKVLDAAGNPVPVREALALINQTLDEALAEQEGDFDADSRWALAWFEQSGFDPGEYGVAETLSKAKNTSVDGMVDAGILVSSRGKVRLLRPNEMPANWDPAKDRRLTAWESVHQLIRALETGGEAGAAELAAKLGSQAETARELAYRLYTICERKKRAAEALSYNALVQSWPEIMRLARAEDKTQPAQSSLFDDE